MAQVDKKLKKWLENTPTDAPKDEVLSIIRRFFNDQFENKSGSHIVVWDDRLKGNPSFGPAGDFTVPVNGGQKVKGHYLKILAQTIILLKDLEK
jgi:hypothetical protein